MKNTDSKEKINLERPELVNRETKMKVAYK